MNKQNKSLLILLGNQLFSNEIIKSLNVDLVFMAEDLDLCSYEKHHKLKLLMFLTAMREKRDELEKDDIKVEYLDIEHTDFNKSYEEKLKILLNNNKIEEIKMFEIEDSNFEERIKLFIKNNDLKLVFISSPMFLIARNEFLEINQKFKILRMGNFYKEIRKKLNILIDKKQNPLGGKWSYDEDNRKKIPKGLPLPEMYKPILSKYVNQLRVTIEKKFPNHPGSMENVWMPVTRNEAIKTFDKFLEEKFNNFGAYEDAILKDNNFLFHSLMSPSLNLGLITPKDIIEKILLFSQKNNIPINSLEGFIRQIIGWREFIRGIYQKFGKLQFKSNHFNLSRKMKNSWYSGETGIPPLDDAIIFSNKYGYTHHINRLMVLSNLMTLSEVDPKNVYHWFMEMYIDSSEWVMTPNVFGMGTFADGGIFSTKPYICGSNYILKMSDYKKGDWCDIVDGLYWRFVSKYVYTLRNNPRLSFMRKTLEGMNVDRKRLIFNCAENFINTHTE